MIGCLSILFQSAFMKMLQSYIFYMAVKCYLFTPVRFILFASHGQVGCLVRKMCCKPTSMKNENWLPFGFLQRSSFLRLIWAAQSTNSKLIAFTKAEECCFHINLWIASPSAHTAEKKSVILWKTRNLMCRSEKGFKVLD